MAESTAPAAGHEGPFERDTAVWLQRSQGAEREFAASVAAGWHAGRGPHGGYLAAMLMRAFSYSVEDQRRSPRSLTIHFLRAPAPGAVSITTTVEREGRSLVFLSARIEQDGALMALALAAFSPAWSGPEISELAMPTVAPPAGERKPGTLIPTELGGPEFASHMTLQRRFGPALPLAQDGQPMETGGWIGLVEPRPLDALALAFFTDALIPTPFVRIGAPAPAPTIDITIHFRTALPSRPADGRPAIPSPAARSDPYELVLARARARLVHEGFFTEDTHIWAADGTLLAQSRQLALLSR